MTGSPRSVLTHYRRTSGGKVEAWQIGRTGAGQTGRGKVFSIIGRSELFMRLSILSTGERASSYHHRITLPKAQALEVQEAAEPMQQRTLGCGPGAPRPMHHCTTVRHREIGTGISEASKRGPIFLHGRGATMLGVLAEGLAFGRLESGLGGRARQIYHRQCIMRTEHRAIETSTAIVPSWVYCRSYGMLREEI